MLLATLTRFSSKPTKDHWTALKRMLRYLKGTVNHGISTVRRAQMVSLMLTGLGGAVTWKSKKQDSTAEAEYVALSSAAQESVSSQGTDNNIWPL